jgi:tRNA(His) 5'-end guanylyltransferase
MWRAKPEEWDDIIIVDERDDKPLAFMSSDEITTLMEIDAELFEKRMHRLERKVVFWREWAMITSGTLIVILAWFIYLCW